MVSATRMRLMQICQLKWRPFYFNRWLVQPEMRIMQISQLLSNLTGQLLLGNSLLGGR